jgi:uncharacterized protein
MKIWLDADGCPNDVKDCVFKASSRTETPVILVADRWVKLPPHPHLQMIVVNSGFNAADDYIADNAVPGDLVVTDDIPLAHRCVSKDVDTLSRRGQEFNSGNIGERLATRDLMEGLRNSGMITGGPAAYNANDKKKFAETFDRLLTKLKAKKKTVAGVIALFSLFAENSASAESTFKVNSALTDTEAAQIMPTDSTGEIALKTPTRSAWSARTAVKIPLNVKTQAGGLQIKEATLALELNEARLSLGRVLVRPRPTTMNESAKRFMRSEPTIDGIQVGMGEESAFWSIFAGGPKAAGFSVDYTRNTTRLCFVYRGERDQIKYFATLGPDGIIELSPRAAHTHEAEISLRVNSQRFEVEGTLQTMSQGEQRIVSLQDERWGKYTQGPTDRSLPQSNNEYRVAAQGKFLLDEAPDGKDWFVVSWLSRTAPRLHDGTEDEKFFKQGGGNESQLTVAAETNNSLFSAQVGVSTEYSPRAKYLYFSERGDDGSRKLVKAKGQLWISTKISF